MTVLALDLSKSCTGWACGEKLSVPVTGSVRLGGPQDDHGRVLSCLACFLEERIAFFKPSVIVFEAPAISATSSYVRLALYLCGTVELVCYERGIRCREANVGSARKSVLGRGSFTQTKGDNANKAASMAWAKSMGYKASNHNEADALVVWQYYTRIVMGTK